jgi:hypothetical protein
MISALPYRAVRAMPCQVAALLERAGAHSAKAVAEAEEALALKVRPPLPTRSRRPVLIVGREPIDVLEKRGKGRKGREGVPCLAATVWRQTVARTERAPARGPPC